MSYPPYLLRFLFLLSLGWACTLSAWAEEARWRYSVRPGDTLMSIAQAYFAQPNDWTKLQRLNRVTEPGRLQPGTILLLPVALLKRAAAAAEVVDVQGKATRAVKNGAPQGLIRGMQLQVGDTVATQAEATLSLRFVDGSRLLFSPNTRATLVEMALLGKDLVAHTVTELVSGSLETQVQPQAPGTRYEIKTNAVNLVVRGTDFRVRVNEQDQVTRSEVLEGAVAATGSGKPVLVAAGHGVVVGPGQAAGAPTPLLGAPNLSNVAPLLDRVPLSLPWAAMQGVERYRAQVFADQAMQQLLLDGVFTGNSAKWADLPDGRYWLRVRAVAQNGLEGRNADREFVLKARPEPPLASSPVAGEKVYGPQAQLRWSKSLTAQAYHVQLSRQADFSSLLADEKAWPKTEFSMAIEPGQYFWRVASIGGAQDHGPFSDTQAYTQRKIPDSPVAEPPAMDEKNLSFRWRAGDAGSSYQFQLAQDAEFSRPLLDKRLIEHQIQMEKPEPGSYYIRIKTLDADGFAGPFGAVQKFEVPAPAPAPSHQPWWLLLLLLKLL